MKSPTLSYPFQRALKVVSVDENYYRWDSGASGGASRFTVGRVESNISEAAIAESEALESTINDSTCPDFLLAAIC